MDTLSLDLLGLVFSNLDALTLCKLAKVSKDFSNVAYRDDVWIEVHGSQRLDTMALVAALVTDLNIGREMLDRTRKDAIDKISDCNSNPFRCFTAENYVRHLADLARVQWTQAARVVDSRELDLSIAYRILGLPFKLRQELCNNWAKHGALVESGQYRIQTWAMYDARAWEIREPPRKSLAKHYGVEKCCAMAVRLGFP